MVHRHQVCRRPRRRNARPPADRTGHGEDQQGEGAPGPWPLDQPSFLRWAVLWGMAGNCRSRLSVSTEKGCCLHRSSVRPSNPLRTYPVETGLCAVQATASLGREDTRGEGQPFVMSPLLTSLQPRARLSPVLATAQDSIFSPLGSQQDTQLAENQ